MQNIIRRIFNMFQQKKINILVGYYWIGLTDEVVEGKWIWYGTNTTASFFDWNGGEPTNAGGNEHCVHVYLYSENNFNWNDLPCTSENFFICEKLFKES